MFISTPDNQQPKPNFHDKQALKKRKENERGREKNLDANDTSRPQLRAFKKHMARDKWYQRGHV